MPEKKKSLKELKAEVEKADAVKKARAEADAKAKTDTKVKTKEKKESWVEKLKRKVREQFNKEKKEHELDIRMRKQLKESGWSDKDVDGLMRPKKE